ADTGDGDFITEGGGVR
nr:RecName: Full=Fibrinogen alpha chain; Contains: RecName: Full=Fibrinopeptide A [Mandrillus leucophaeus]